MNQYLYVVKSTEIVNPKRLIPILPSEADVFKQNPETLNDLIVFNWKWGKLEKVSSFDSNPRLVTINWMQAIESEDEHYCAVAAKYIENQERYIGMLIMQRYDGYQPYCVVNRESSLN